MKRSLSLAVTARRPNALSTCRKSIRISNGLLFRQRPAAQSYGSSAKIKDWNAAQYLKFEEQRTRPSRDLLSKVPLDSPRRIIDLGCGPGNSTAVVVERYPQARVTGLDSSSDMIMTARAALPHVDFTLSDLTSYTPDEPVDLLFSNAVFQWIAYADRIPIIRRLIQSLQPGGVLALQVPDNYLEPSHSLMRSVAQEGPWSEILGPLKPGLGPFQTPQQLYDAVKPLCLSVDIWSTHYQHVLSGHDAIVEWVKGTGLRPFIDPLATGQKDGFLKAYLEGIKKVYPSSVDGNVLLRYPRLFMVAVRA